MLAQALDGKPVNMSKVNSFAGPEDPKTIFTNGGSENIPVTCRAVKYIKEGNPAWFTNYFNIQFDGSVGLFGKELFSNIYGSLTVGNVIVVRNEAARRGHAELERKASEWLRAYWTTLALAADQSPVKLSQAYQYDESSGKEAFTSQSSNAGGYGVVLPGNRSYVNTYPGGVGFQSIMFSMALAHPGRSLERTLDVSPGAYGGLCVAMKSLGYAFTQDGKVNLTSKNPPPESFGLTASQRDMLKGYVVSNGKNNASGLLNILSPYRLACELTIVRTTQGITSWFGNETDKVGLCSRSKGGTFTAGTLLFGDHTATYISRATRENQPEAATTWVENKQVCEESENLPKKCIDIAPGARVNTISWPRGGQIKSR